MPTAVFFFFQIRLKQKRSGFNHLKQNNESFHSGSSRLLCGDTSCVESRAEVDEVGRR